MDYTLAINVSSSSKKLALFLDDRLLLSARLDSKGDDYILCTIFKEVMQDCQMINRHLYHDSLVEFLKRAVELQVITHPSVVAKVVMRMVVPGTFFQSHREIDLDFTEKLKTLEPLLSSHIPGLLKEISAVRRHLPKAKIIAASDSEFHRTIPDFVRRYSLPEADVKKCDLVRFGFHGLSVWSVVERVHSVIGIDPKRVLVCHLGSGVSVTAIKDGQSVDTSFGFYPGSGLLMGSRAGDVDAGALLTLMQYKNLKPLDAQNYLQTQGGLEGLAGESDLRILLERRSRGDLLATSALESFVYQIRQKIGAAWLVLGGVDAVVFTAQAGERSSVLRSLILADLENLGIELDEEKNDRTISREGVISSITSSVKVAVIKSETMKAMLRIARTFKD